MITGELKQRVDALWDEFWSGGISNPLTVIEQITYLMFFRLVELRDDREARRAARTGEQRTSIFIRVAGDEGDQLRWSRIREMGDPSRMHELVRDRVFPFMQKVGEDHESPGISMRDAQFMIQKPALLAKAMELIDELPLTDRDVKGDLYEYMLGKLNTAGINGQFRTPRHVIEAMATMADPRPGEVVCDPAVGTAGFLVGAIDHLFKSNTSSDGVVEDEAGGLPTYSGDLLGPEIVRNLGEYFWGFDFDATMLRIAGMNLLLHHIDGPRIQYQDTLGHTFADRHPKEASEAFDVILANPPFAGSLDYDTVDASILRTVKTKKTELLFLALMLRMLKLGGRACVVVPEGVLFGSSKAHQAIRRTLIDDHQLDAVIGLPSGVFKPYAGVKTAVLHFTKGGETKDVFFYDVGGDGFSLDDRREPRPNENDLPDLLDQWQAWRDERFDEFDDRTARHFRIPVEEIRDRKYDLSVNRYREEIREEIVHEDPADILGRLDAIAAEIVEESQKLKDMIR